MEARNLGIAVAVVLLAGTGCGRRAVRVGLPNLAIPVNCVSAVTLVHCDARINPPKCESARVKYRSGCEEIVVQRGAD